MNEIIILGSENEPAIQSFIAFLQSHQKRFYFTNEIKSLDFALDLSMESSIIHLKIDGEVKNVDNLGFYIHSIEQLIPYKKGRDNKFVAQEYYSSIWAFFGAVRKVINPPTKWAWNYNYPLQKLKSFKRIPEIWSSNINQLDSIYDECSNFHVELSVKNKRLVLPKKDLVNLGDELIKIQFADTNKYHIVIVVGQNSKPILQEIELTPNFEENFINLKNEIHQIGLVFYAVVFTKFNEEVYLVRILPNPPYSWYEDYSRWVNYELMNFLTP